MSSLNCAQSLPTLPCRKTAPQHKCCASTAISATEKRRREAAVNFARASVGLEGFTPSEAAETGARQFIRGDIQLADFVQVKVNAR